ncbi:MAG: hypothetical protein EOM24_28100 [Chloroflexia bacterium]|nr:hypothetical protein [Chloroflexia bacterium]
MPAPEFKRPKSLSTCYTSTEFLKAGDLSLLLPWCRTTIDKMVDAGELPAPDLVRNRNRYWRKASILPVIDRILSGEVR